MKRLNIMGLTNELSCFFLFLRESELSCFTEKSAHTCFFSQRVLNDNSPRDM
jgi:hypothetical protein